MMLEFTIAAILIELTPGPNMTWLAVLGANRGRRSAFAAVGGIALGLAVAAVVSGIGLTALLYRVPALFAALRWAGTLYLFYLAYDAWTDADDHPQTDGHTIRQSFMQGLVSNALNPKAYLFYAALLPRFIDPAGNAVMEVTKLSAIYVAVATTTHFGIAAASGSMAPWLQSSPNAVLVRRSLAILIAAAAIWFFYSTGTMK
jgi:threonine/homoserine/homoserine lactone efflux protein